MHVSLKLCAVVLASHSISEALGTSFNPQLPFSPPQQPKVLCKGRQTPFLQKGPTLKFVGIL